MVSQLLRSDLQRQLALANQLALRESSRSLQKYLDHVVINSSPEPRRFSEVREPWQTTLWEKPDRIIEAVGLGRPLPSDAKQFILDVLPRGHDKTSAIARRVTWILAFGTHRVSIVVAASDSEQAEILLESMDSELQLNPWLKDRVRMSRSRAYGQGGHVKVLSSDAPSSFGKNADIIIVDEWTHWKKRDLWDAIVSGKHKRKSALLLVITNAGVRGSWQWDIYQSIRDDPLWDVWESPPYVQHATWLDLTALASLRKTLPKGLARRVLDNVWIDPGEESGFLTRQEVEACEQLGRELGLILTWMGRNDVDYVAGIDYGPKRDRTALSILHHGHDKRIHVDELTVIQGSPDAPVPIQKVEEWIVHVNSRFHKPLLVIDPYQMEGTAQRFEHHQNLVRFESRGGKSNYEMAATLRSLVVNKQLVWYPGAGDLPVTIDGVSRVETLTDELAGLVIRPTLYGYRFDHEVKFHDDRAVSIGMAALFAARNPPAPEFISPPVLPQPTRKVPLPELHTPAGGRGLWGTR